MGNGGWGSYKSNGENRIAEFLERYNIPFEYERPILINDRNYQRIVYPDFNLSKYGGILIEYFGIENSPEYDRGIEYKISVYKDNYLDMIPLYPSCFQKDWQRYLIKGINEILYKRHSDFRNTMQKKYFST